MRYTLSLTVYILHMVVRLLGKRVKGLSRYNLASPMSRRDGWDTVEVACDIQAPGLGSMAQDGI